MNFCSKFSWFFTGLRDYRYRSFPRNNGGRLCIFSARKSVFRTLPCDLRKIQLMKFSQNFWTIFGFVKPGTVKANLISAFCCSLSAFIAAFWMTFCRRDRHLWVSWNRPRRGRTVLTDVIEVAVTRVPWNFVRFWKLGTRCIACCHRNTPFAMLLAVTLSLDAEWCNWQAVLWAANKQIDADFCYVKNVKGLFT